MALHNEISGSELMIWEDFAHALSPKHFERLAGTIDVFIKNNPKQQGTKKGALL